MNKPYIICHMMTSVDGRIDCAMTSQLPGVEDYYKTLDELNVPTTVSGRVTAELEMAEPGFFESKNSETYTQEGFSKKADAKGYEIIVDTKGKLLWPDASDMDNGEKEHVVKNIRTLQLFLLPTRKKPLLMESRKRKKLNRTLTSKAFIRNLAITISRMTSQQITIRITQTWFL